MVSLPGERMLKVCIVLSLRRMWRGGISYYNNLLSSYRSCPDAGIRLLVATDRPEDLADLRSESIEIRFCQDLAVGGVLNWPRRKWRSVLRRQCGFDPKMLRFMEKEQVDLISHVSIGRQNSINTLFWQPDFQHRVLPHLFSSAERQHRDSEIAAVGEWGNILLSSASAVNDFRQYYPELSGVRAHILHFPSLTAISVPPIAQSDLARDYPIQDPYLFLPNQFWCHKNHSIVVEALRDLPQNIRVICTGLMEDRRNVSYVPELLSKVKRYGLTDRFLCLGEVSYKTMISLMHYSMAVIQPSLFEGWSTTVEEAKALGKRIVLSDIAVHREQAPERGEYFDAHSAEALAVVLRSIYEEFDLSSERVTRKHFEKHREGLEGPFAKDFCRILRAVASQSGEE